MFGKSNKGGKSSAKSPKAKTTMNSVQSKKNKTHKNPMAKVESAVGEVGGVMPEKAAQEAAEAEAEDAAEAKAGQAAEADPDLVRAQCTNAVELAFPSQRWATESSLKLFAENLVSEDRQSETIFARPMGSGLESQLKNFTGDVLFEWFKKELNPEVLRYTEIITSEVAVSKNVCSMDALILVVLGNCIVPSRSHLMIEVDGRGKLVKWIEHYDLEDFNDKISVCKGELANIM
ncbi:hypothetical protein ACHAWF_008364 [Thalassiosira exigua]